MTTKVLIVGSGPCGVLLCHYLLPRGNYKIDIYDRRSDPRTISFSNYRAYPITLSERGLRALREIDGLEEVVKAQGVEITGTIFHIKNGKSKFVSKKKPLIGIDRTALVINLLEQLTKKFDDSQLNIHFNSKCTQVDLKTKTVTFENETTEELIVNYDLLIGADGCGSVVRKHLLKTEGFKCQQNYVRSQYKTVFLPGPSEEGHNLKLGNMHGWRTEDRITMLAVPQRNKTVSGVVFFPHENNQVTSLSSTEDVRQFFSDNFPEIGKSISDVEVEAFLKKPISKVSRVWCNRYHYGDSVLIMGDAAHAVSPFIGQGCNSALEDAVVLNKLLNDYSDNLVKVVPEFTKHRLADGQALLELSEYTFPLSKWLFFEYVLRMNFARMMNKVFPKYCSPFFFDMLSETTVPYSEILNSAQGWISKVKKSNDKLLQAEYLHSLKQV